MTKDEFIIIGDIAGNFDALERILSQVPDKITIFALGDSIDKGPQSKEVLAYLQGNPRAHLILGNHEYLMLQSIVEADSAANLSDLKFGNLWLQSRGIETIESYLQCKIRNTNNILQQLKDFGKEVRGDGIFDFMRSCPIAYCQDDLILSHSPASMKWMPKYLKKHGLKTHRTLLGIDPISHQSWIATIGEERRPAPPPPISYPDFLFTRKHPIPVKERLHVFGHMSRWGYREFNRSKENSPGNLCIDTSKDRTLTALLWPSQKLVSTKI